MSTLERLVKEVEERLTLLRKERYSVPKDQRALRPEESIYNVDPLPMDFIPSHEAYKRLDPSSREHEAVATR